MPVMKVSESNSKYGAPQGIYLGKFLGLFPMKQDTPRLDKNGKPMGPAVEWQFEITDGECAGKIVGRITAAAPTTGNSCGKLLSGLIGRPVGRDEEVNPDGYVGQPYQIVMGPKKDTPTEAYVTQIVRVKGSAAAPAPPAGPKPATPPPPPGAKPVAPPPPPGTPPTAGVPEPHYHVWDAKAGASERVSGTQARQLLKEGKLMADTPCMNDDQSSGWKTINDFGLAAPF